MMMALQGLLPLLVFAIVDIFAGMRTAIIAAILFALIEAGWSWYQFGEIDSVTWISLGLILLMGLISIRMQDARLFKFQPVVMALVLALALAWFEWQGNPLLVQMMPKVAALMPPEQQALLNDEGILKSMARMDLLMIPAFIAHAALVAWAAIRRSTIFWLIARGVGFYVLMGVALLANFLIPMK
jgi:intracellular septation protein